jgi:DNA-binding SARP family transcriptional activator
MNSGCIRLLGGFSLDIGNEMVHFPTQKSIELFAYLLLAQKRVSREIVATALWADADEVAGKRQLRTTLWRLRQVLHAVPDTQLESNASTIVLHCPLQVDTVLFERLATSIDRFLPPDQDLLIQEAMQWYRGDLLEGRAYDWCEEQREYFRSLHARLLRRIAKNYRALGNFRAAISHAGKLLEIDPSDEDAHREIILSYHLSGDRDAALSQFGRLRAALRTELGIEPSQASIELWQYVQSEGQHPVPVRALRLRNEELNDLCRPQIIGRQEVLRTLTSFINQVAAGTGCAAIMSGQAGIGKSTLVEELALEAGLRGFEVLQGSCPGLQDSAPYQVFVQALWPRITVAERDLADAPSALKVLLSTLTPYALTQVYSDKPSSPTPMNSAIVNETLLGQLAGKYEAKPTVLILEDLHQIDKASISVLTALLSRLRRLRLLVLGTVREEEPGSRELVSRLVALGADLVELQPLSETEVAELIQGVLRSKHVADDLVSYTWKRTNGVPLFVLELLKFLKSRGLLARGRSGQWSLAQPDRKMPMSIPSRVHDLIRRRIETLEEVDHNTLSAAAVLGFEIRFDDLRELVGLSENELVMCTNRLARAHLVAEKADGFRFLHESVRLVGISSTNKVRLRVLHLKVANLLELRMPWLKEDLAWHFEEAGCREKALECAEACGDKARSVHANANADEWYSKALIMVENFRISEDCLHRRVELLKKRQEVRELLGDRAGQARDVDAIDAAAYELKDTHLRGEAAVLRSSLLIRGNRGREALREALHAIRTFRAIGDVAGESRAHEIAGLVYLNIRRYDLAQSAFQRALSMCRSIKERAGEARSLIHLSTALAHRVRNLDAIKCLDKAEVILEELEDDRSRSLVLIQKGILYRCLGKAVISERLLQDGLNGFRKIGDKVGEARGLSHLAVTHAIMGRLREAVHESEQALRMVRRSGDLRAEIMIMNNAAYGVLRLVGDFKRAQRFGSRAMRLVGEDRGSENATLYADSVAAVLLEQGNLEAAYHWAKLSRSLSSARGMRGTWIDLSARFTVGCICLERGRVARALRHLSTVRARLESCGESELELRTIGAIARAHLARADSSAALGCLNEMRGLLAKMDSAEKMQEIHWTCFRVLHSCQNFSAAKRSLRKAYECMMDQMKTLKGPMRRRFMAIPINVKIAEAAAKILGGRIDPVLVEIVPASNGNHHKQARSYHEVPIGQILSAPQNAALVTSKAVGTSEVGP